MGKSFIDGRGENHGKRELKERKKQRKGYVEKNERGMEFKD